MKVKRMKLIDLKVKSFTTNLERKGIQTIAGGGRETTPDPTPITTTDEPIKVPATGFTCPDSIFNCPSGHAFC